MFTRSVGGILLAALAVSPALAADPARAKVTVVFDHVLPNVAGKSMKGVLVEYGPGGSSPGHTHPPSAFTVESPTSTIFTGPPSMIFIAASISFAFRSTSFSSAPTSPCRLRREFEVVTAVGFGGH